MSTRTFRQARKKEDEVDLIKQKFPADFKDATALSTASALFIIQQRMAESAAGGSMIPDLPMDKEIVSKIYSHLKKFQEAPDPQEVVERRTFLLATSGELGISNYEIAQVLALQPQSADEAKVLIPSFERFEQDEEVAGLRQFLLEATKPF